MLLRIEHNTVYDYDQPARYSIQYLRVTPRTHGNQRVRRWTVDAPSAMHSFVDGYWNVVRVLTLTRPHESLSIRVSGEIETTETHGVLPPEGEPLPTSFYLSASPLCDADPAMRDLAEGLRRELDRGVLNFLHALMAAIHERVAYEVGATHVTSTAATAFAQRTGVCQDHAHIFIGCCRAMGIPARYVSGYLFTGPDRIEHKAGHAWAEAFVPDLGWTGFDVSNAVCPHAGYVRVAAGLDYAAAAPIRGMHRGGNGEQLSVNVRVEDSSQQ